MKVALVQPPNSANSVRGVGVYLSSLYAQLAEIPNLNISLERFDPTGLAYQKFDLVHFPYFDFFFLTLPIVKLTKFVITVHDLTPLVFPHDFPPGIKGTLKWQVQKFNLNRADHIISVSNSTKQDIIKQLNISENKITTIYEAAGKDFKLISNKDDLTKARKKLKLPEKYLLYVGDVNPNKNLSRMLEAFSKVSSSLPEFKLVCVGKSFQNESLSEVQKLKKQISDEKLQDKILFPGYVSEAELVYYYNLASLYIQPSLYEGFGLPILESMACGCPVICGRNSSLSEVGGEAANYVEETSPDEISAKIISVLKTPRENYQKKSLSQAAKFSWEITAKETKSVYEKILH